MKKFLSALAVSAALLSSSAYAEDSIDIAVIVGSAQDGFWNMVKKGVDDASLMVKANGGTVNFMQTQNYDNFGPDLAALIEQAVAQGAEGIAIPNWLPESESPGTRGYVRRSRTSQEIVAACPDLGITHLTVHTFQPEDAQSVAEKLLKMGEQQVNAINERTYSDQVSNAQRNYDEANHQLSEIEALATRNSELQ